MQLQDGERDFLSPELKQKMHNDIDYEYLR